LSQKGKEVKGEAGPNVVWRKVGGETEILFSNTVVDEEIGCVRKTNDTIYTER